MAWHVLSEAKRWTKAVEGSCGPDNYGPNTRSRGSVCTRLKAAEATTDHEIGVSWISSLLSTTYHLLWLPRLSLPPSQKRLILFRGARNTWSVPAWNYATPSIHSLERFLKRFLREVKTPGRSEQRSTRDRWTLKGQIEEASRREDTEFVVMVVVGRGRVTVGWIGSGL